ncbi:MAG TPA: ATP-dependent DNA helicase RecG [Dehalococcoidia bacterium]|nr:ATP-dependent DNA helicase RecG [Dehalococcoidia bacterium]
MNQTLESLKKILQLEQAKDYTNLAVMGGLDRYLQGCLDKGELLPLKKVCPPDFNYAALGKDARKNWVERALRELVGSPTAKQQKVSTPPQPARVLKKTPITSHSLSSSIIILKGISPTLAARFAKLGVKTVQDMLYFFPRRHLDYSQKKSNSELEVGIEQTIVANLWEARQITLGGRRGTEAILGDETGNIRAVWFNQPYLAKMLRTNAQIVLSGKVSLFKGSRVLESPEWEPMESEDLTHTGRLVPLYPLTSGLTPRRVRKLVKETVAEWAPQLPDFLPHEIQEHCSLIDLPQAIQQAHYPDSEPRKDEARRRLAFDELFLIQLGVLSRKQEWQESQRGNPFQTDVPLLESFLSILPFTLTPAQQRVLGEILSDLAKPKPMCRLLQGEVGSGKTVVATAALLLAVANGYQGAFMAPTEILAEQHFSNIAALLSKVGKPEEEGHLYSYSSLLHHPFTIALLIGSLSPGEKQRLQQLIREGSIDLVIGTHALIQSEVEFNKLGLVVVDEQHRFGVLQRSALRQKGFNPHVLVMTATPIPRTLALTLYGDLDLSVIDQLPPGRREIETKWLNPKQREGAYAFLRQKIAQGRQAFIICPLIEESESIEARAATVEYQRLSKEVFPDLRLGLLHGRMPAAEKEETMRCFRDGGVDILVSTPVVEVGIDVPNAAVMLIEGAERFGLSQLHQFRGRVGRGEHKSYCLLLAETPSPEGRARLEVIRKTQDGFLLAEEDLRLRGPGEFFGTRQSGLPDLRMARLSDVVLLELAREEALCLFQQDPGLKQPEHRLLAEEVARLWERGGEAS